MLFRHEEWFDPIDALGSYHRRSTNLRRGDSFLCGYRVRQRYSSITGIIDSLIRAADGGAYHLEASIAVRNEPFPGSGTICDNILT